MVSQGKYLELDSILETPFLVALADDPGTLVNRMETPEFQTVADYLRGMDLLQQPDGRLRVSGLGGNRYNGGICKTVQVPAHIIRTVWEKGKLPCGMCLPNFPDHTGIDRPEGGRASITI